MKANQAGQNFDDPMAHSGNDVESTVDNAVQDAHDTVDQWADAAAPAVRQLQDKVNASVDSLGASADRVRQAGEDGTESLRAMVRDRPLVALAAAAAIGLLVARLAR